MYASAVVIGRDRRFGVRRQQQNDDRLTLPVEDLACRIEAVDPGQVHVHEDEVRRELARKRDGILAGLGLADDIEPLRRLDDQSGRHAERLLVVHYQHTNGHPRLSSTVKRRTGRAQRQ